MRRLFVTGDIHQSINIDKLNTAHFKCDGLTKDDILVIMGDAGLIWSKDKSTPREQWWIDWLNSKPWTTFCVLGNHENYDRIENLPTTTFGGEMCYQVADSIFYAISGKVYDLCGQKCLVVNGAESHDIFVNGKRYRWPHESWWEQEQITEEDIAVAEINLEKAGGTVDFVFSHTGGSKVCNYLGFEPTISDKRLDRILDKAIYQKHFCGHYHKDMMAADTRILFNDILLIALDKPNT